MEKNQLNQFGAILSFAIKLETNLKDYYQNPSLGSNYPQLNDEFEQRATSFSKRAKNLERARRENVTEITLEPITGLDVTNYHINLEDYSLENMNQISNIMKKFYSEAGPKINVREVNRLFQRIVKEYNNLQNLK